MVGCGGFIGAVLRYLVSLGTQRLLGTPLYATLVVNVVGCLVIGFLGGLAEERQYLRPPTPPIPLRRHPRRLHHFFIRGLRDRTNTARRSSSSRLSPHWPATAAGHSRRIRRVLGGPLAA